MFRSLGGDRAPLRNSIVDIAFERLESLWDSWVESRHASRALVTKSVLLNISLILNHGTDEDEEHLVEYVAEFDDNLRAELDKLSLLSLSSQYEIGEQMEFHFLGKDL